MILIGPGRAVAIAEQIIAEHLQIGLDFDPIGVYVAKSVSDTKEPANFFVRVRKRF